MKKKIAQLFKHPLILGGTTVFSGVMVGNVFNFLFNLFMSRNLPLSDFGVVATFASFILLFGLVSHAFTPSVVSFAGKYFAKDQTKMILGLFLQFTKLALFVGLVILLALYIFSTHIAQFLHITDLVLLPLVGLSILMGFVNSVNMSILQAKLSFRFLSILQPSSAFAKLAIGILLVFLGFGVGGAMWAYFLSYVLYYFISFIPLFPVLWGKSSASSVEWKKLIGYGLPSSLSIVGLTLFITTDITLVKHFYSPSEAGLYAGLVLLGKIIYFFSAPIATVMFPLIVHRHAREEKYANIFYMSLLMVFIASIGITIFYALFPEFVIRVVLKNEEYLVLKPLIAISGLFFSVYSLLSIIVNFYLSIQKTNVFIPLIFGAFLQAILLWFYHSSFYGVIVVSAAVGGFTLFLLLGYYIYLLRNGKIIVSRQGIETENLL